jgi:hypothetical protein
MINGPGKYRVKARGFPVTIVAVLRHYGDAQ